MPLIQIGGVWLKESNSGTKYMQGTAKEEFTIPMGAKICLFKNDKKGNPKAPDYNLSFDPGEDQQQQNRGGNQQQNRGGGGNQNYNNRNNNQGGGGGGNRQQQHQDRYSSEVTDEDIPF